MKSYRAARCIKNRNGKQMINIYQHREYHNSPRSLPDTSKKYECEDSREDEMEGVVEQGLKHKKVLF
jgi:hypothetical protein